MTLEHIIENTEISLDVDKIDNIRVAVISQEKIMNDINKIYTGCTKINALDENYQLIANALSFRHAADIIDKVEE